MCVPCLCREPVVEEEVTYGPDPLMEPINVALESIQFLLEKGREQGCLTLAREIEERMWGTLPGWMKRVVDCMYACLWERRVNTEEVCMLLDRLYDQYGPVVLGMALNHFDPKEEIKDGYEGLERALEVFCHEASMDLQLIFERCKETQLPVTIPSQEECLRFACSVVVNSGCINQRDPNALGIAQQCTRDLVKASKSRSFFNSKNKVNHVLLISILQSKHLNTN